MAVVVENGKPWCKQHAPSAKAARQQVSQERWEQQRKAQNAPHSEILRLRKALERIASVRYGNYAADKEMLRRFAIEALTGDSL
jgi:hypothetical protein